MLAAVLLLAPSPAFARQQAIFCTQQYDPVCAELRKPVKGCPQVPCPPLVLRKTFSNACFAHAAGARVLHKGACRTRPPQRPATGCGQAENPAGDPSCRSWTDGCNICQRAMPGAAPTCTKMACARKAPARCLLHFGERP